MSRAATSRSDLLRHGFVDSDRTLDGMARLGPHAEPLVALIGGTADPDLALQGLLRLGDVVDDRDRLLGALVDDEGTAMRLLSVLGASQALADHLARHPEHWPELTDPTMGSTRPAAYAVRASLLEAVGADPLDAVPVAMLADQMAEQQALDALRVEYRRNLLRLAARDLAHHVGVDDVAAELSDLAAGTLEAGLAIARAHVGTDATDVRLAVIAMGKCGGHELNYVSDVDVIFCFEPVEGASESDASRVATQLATHLMRACSEHTREGTIWPVDAALRPEGKAGPLVRTMAGMRGYYGRWAKTWEFQALLKARPVAGDLALGQEFVDMVWPMVWGVAGRDGFVEDVQAMRRRVVDTIPVREADRQLKLGVGGLRDVEFAVQLLQLVHGRSDETLRVGATLSALAALTSGGYVGRVDGEAMHQAYAFLRTLEHRIQLFQLRRTHVVPTDAASLRRIARGMGYVRDSEASLDDHWQSWRREVRRLHEKLFYRPLLTAVARMPGDDIGLSTAAAESRLSALGFVDPKGALRHLEALTSGVSRTASIQRALMPAMLGWFADSSDPDAGLFGFRRLSESLGSTPWYLGTLRDEGHVAERLARVLGTSRFATNLIEREPLGVRMLGEDLTPRSAVHMMFEMTASAGRQDDPVEAVRSIRAVRRRELLRLAAGDLFGEIDVADVGAALSRLTDATLETTLNAVGRAVREQQGLDAAPTAIAIVAMGRYGGFELSYGSDADVMFVHDPVPGADPQVATTYAQTVANELRRLLALPMTDPPLEVDADLRPEGKQGPLVRTLDSYSAYYAKWSKVWEFQALLRADAVVGDEDLRRRFTELIDPLRFAASGIAEADVAEVRRVKARIDRERLPRGADPKTHLKLGRGGLADIEWTVQLLQMRHAGTVAGLRTPRTLDALAAATDAGLLSADDADVLVRSWRTVSRVRNAITLVQGKGSNQLPSDPRTRVAMAAVLGYPPGGSDEMVNDYLRITRRARAVVDRVFWG